MWTFLWMTQRLHLPWKWISVVRLDAVFYGPVGGVHCLLKWCFNVPTVTMAVVYTKHRACGRGRESWRRGSRRRTTRGGRRGEKKTRHSCKDVFCMLQAAGNELSKPGSWRPLCWLWISPQSAIMSRIILKLLKTKRRIIIHQFQSMLWIFHCWIWHGLLVLINHIPAVRCWSSEGETWNSGDRVDSEEYL